jgi:hypothetical protein
MVVAGAAGSTASTSVTGCQLVVDFLGGTGKSSDSNKDTQEGFKEHHTIV